MSSFTNVSTCISGVTSDGGTMHMSWDSLDKYSDTSLSARVRLVYWLRRIWYTYHPECGKHLPLHYDSLLRRYVRDFGQDDRWEAAGDASVSLAKWRALPVQFHIDQQIMCPFYSQVDPTFMHKGLQLTKPILSPYFVRALRVGLKVNSQLRNSEPSTVHF